MIRRIVQIIECYTELLKLVEGTALRISSCYSLNIKDSRMKHAGCHSNGNYTNCAMPTVSLVIHANVGLGSLLISSAPHADHPVVAYTPCWGFSFCASRAENRALEWPGQEQMWDMGYSRCSRHTVCPRERAVRYSPYMGIE